MTRARTIDDEVVIRTKKEDRERDRKILRRGFKTGVCVTSKKMIGSTVPQQMAFHKHRKSVEMDKSLEGDLLEDIWAKHDL